MKTDKEIRDEFANGATSAMQENNTNEGTIYVFNMVHWNNPKLIHNTAVSIGERLDDYVIIDNESELGKTKMIFLLI